MAPNNSLQPWGNDKTMNLNTLILTNIQSSPYFKVQLFELKTFHEVVDEIYYRVDHLEPWEKGSRKTAGQTGMCGGVRGVGAGGIVSSAYCLLFKLFTLKLTKKQVNNLITHSDSPYIRGLGFMYIRYSQSPGDLWDWYEPYLDDDEELDVKAGGGHMMTIGEMLRQWLVKLEWYSTLFPRVPVPIQKDLDVKMRSKPAAYGFQGFGDQGGGGGGGGGGGEYHPEPDHIPDEEVTFGEAERAAQAQRVSGKSRQDTSNGSSYSQNSSARRRSPPSRRPPSPRRNPYSRDDDFSKDLERERNRQKREKEKDHRPSKEDRHRSRSREKRKSRSRSRDRQARSRSKERKEYRKEKSHKKEKKSHKRSKDKSRDRERVRSRSREREHSRDYDGGRSRERGGSRDDERPRVRDRSRERDRDKRH